MNKKRRCYNCNRLLQNGEYDICNICALKEESTASITSATKIPKNRRKSTDDKERA
jgi:hypothetical protein